MIESILVTFIISSLLIIGFTAGRITKNAK